MTRRVIAVAENGQNVVLDIEVSDRAAAEDLVDYIESSAGHDAYITDNLDLDAEAIIRAQDDQDS